MASTLKDLLAQREALEAKIAELRAAEVSEAKAKIQALIAEYGLTPEDIFAGKSSTKALKSPTTKVAAKYIGPNGETYSGRGLKPKWLSALIAAGHSKDEYLIKK